MAEQQQGLVGTATPDTETPTHEQKAADVWQRTMGMSSPKPAAPAPITKEDVRGNDPNPEAPVIPDRALVTGKIAEILSVGAPAPVDPVAERLAQLEDKLTPKAQPENPAVYKEIQALRAELAERDRLEVEQQIAEEREARMRTLREGFVAEIEESEDFPAIKAAGFAEKVFDQLHAAQLAGEDVSEAEVLSKTEADLWSLYEALSALKDPTTSEEAPVSETPTPTPTLTPALSATDAPRDLESIYADVRGDRRAAATEVWNNIFNR